ncbi:MAG: class I SAM-dependent methyltransferase [Chryseolinea sp.]
MSNQGAYTEIEKCRIGGSNNLIQVLSLGSQYLTGVFPKSTSEDVTKGPLDVVWCPDSGLLQMKQSYSLSEMYGDNYGYRSGLNQSMVQHLTNKIRALERLIKLSSNDLVIDIGSNDATSLRAYTAKCNKVGIDPTGKKFIQYYSDDIRLIPDFFSKEVFRKNFQTEKAKIITSIAMFYDLEHPANFVEDIESVLDDDGIWHFEQSYMPSMLRTNSYDTICHEHLEFYSFKVVKNLLESCGMRVIDVQMNSINGGSFAVTACKHWAKFRSNMPVINWMLQQESDMGLDTPKPYRDFEERVFRHRKNLVELINALTLDGKKIIGYGASTKGNVLLQFCGLTSKQIPYIAEVNEDKFGAFTPGTHIPIISESEAKAMKPDYFLVLPWHFKNNILEREKEYIAQGGKFIFPLPEIEIV